MSHHDTFKSLSPVDWADIVSQTASDTLPKYLTDIFGQAQTLIDSIPDPPSKPPATGRARAATDSAAFAPHIANHPREETGGDEQTAGKIRKEWKEVKVAAKENPMGINVWKLGSKDGKGAWFARRSIHRELGFERWKEGLEREFEETLKRNGEVAGEEEIGAAKIRGIGAERRVEDVRVDDVARLQVYQLSVRFPGPTTPRDFVTLLATSEVEAGRRKGRRPRQFMVVSKPCVHPECPQRNGFIRGQYESVEIVREVPVDKPLRRTRSSIDLSREDFARPATNVSQGVGKEALLRSAQKAAGRAGQAGDEVAGRTVSFAGLGATPSVPQAKSDVGPEDEVDDPEMAVEWLMITRSDPGGSVPRFMVEKGTPPGICNDAGKFVKWLFSEDFNKSAGLTQVVEGGDGTVVADGEAPPLPARKTSSHRFDPRLEPVPDTVEPERDESHGSGGLYSMITNALGAAGSMVASFTGSARTDSEVDTLNGDNDFESDTSSLSDASFASAEEGPDDDSKPMSAPPPADQKSVAPSSRSTKSAISEESATLSTAATSTLQHEKDLRKLEERRRKAEDKMARMQERALAKQAKGAESEEKTAKEAAALAKLKEKHDRELAKQEEKYRKEVKKLEEKRVAEEKKAEERRRKAAEREEKANIQMELERTRAERDVALKQIEILKAQVGELQGQNTRLVARLGREGVKVEVEE